MGSRWTGCGCWRWTPLRLPRGWLRSSNKRPAAGRTSGQRCERRSWSCWRQHRARARPLGSAFTRTNPAKRGPRSSRRRRQHSRTLHRRRRPFGPQQSQPSPPLHAWLRTHRLAGVPPAKLRRRQLRSASARRRGRHCAHWLTAQSGCRRWPTWRGRRTWPGARRRGGSGCGACSTTRPDALMRRRRGSRRPRPQSRGRRLICRRRRRGCRSGRRAWPGARSGPERPRAGTWPCWPRQSGRRRTALLEQPTPQRVAAPA